MKQYLDLLQDRFATKGVDRTALTELLLQPMYFAAAMVRAGDADGSLAGAAHTTAETLRAALRVIRPAASWLPDTTKTAMPAAFRRWIWVIK